MRFSADGYQIYTIKADGTGQTPLANGDITVMNADGSGQVADE